MNLLEEKIAQEYYDTAEEIDKSGKPFRAKVSAFKTLFYSLFRELTADENFDFVNHASRIDYAVSNYSLGEDTLALIKWTKKRLYKKLLKPVKSLNEIEYTEIASAILNIIKALSGKEIPGALMQFSALPEKPFISAEQEEKPVFVDYCRCTVESVTGIQTGASGYKFFFIYCDGEGDTGNFSIRILSYHFEDFHFLHKNIKKLSTLGIHNFEQSKGYGGFYISTQSTLIVIEPDFLVEASETAECFHNGGINMHTFFIRKLLPSYSSLAAYKGTLINALFDAVILNPDASPDKIIHSGILSSPVIPLRFGGRKIAEIAGSVLDPHFKNIKAVLSSKSTNNIRIEPTFVAPEYGLAGRLDALSVPSDDPQKMNIVELKSGREHKSSVWINHRMQITAYNLLLKSAYGKSRKGSSFIFYSGSEKSPYRNISVSEKDEKNVIAARNRIVTEIINLSFSRFGLLHSLKSDNINVPEYHSTEIKNFRKVIAEASDIEQRYYRNLLSFLLREYKCSKTGSDNFTGNGNNGFASLWLDSEEEKEDAFGLLKELELVKFEENTGTLHFRHRNSGHNFREGDFAMMYSAEAGKSGLSPGEILRGNISEINGDSVIFSLRNKQIYNDFFSLNSKWNIERDIIESNFWSAARSLYGFLCAPKHRREIILGLRKPSLQETDFREIEGLSEDQNENIRKALCAKDYFLLQGPPGTGKTSTALINIVRRLKTSGKNIFILAYTNRAVNEICGKLGENNIDFKKLGSAAAPDDGHFDGISIEETADAIRRDYLEKSVFVSTITSFNNRIDDYGAVFSLDTVIIDEASQITEADIAGIISRFEKFILIGDQNQLPSVVVQSEKSSAVNDSSLNSIGISNLNVSYFERMYNLCRKNKWNESTGMLKSHYRMHSEISGLINGAYNGELVPVLESQKAPLVFCKKYSDNGLEKVLYTTRALFIGSAFEKRSKANSDEAFKTRKILEMLIDIHGENFGDSFAGVITPWRAQIALIKNGISGNPALRNITVDTVERFQGSERNVIILSLAVYNSLQLKRMQSLNTTGVDRKLLVALSRAKEQVIILGNENALIESAEYRNILNIIRDKKGYYGYNESALLFG